MRKESLAHEYASKAAYAQVLQEFRIHDETGRAMAGRPVAVHRRLTHAKRRCPACQVGRPPGDDEPSSRCSLCKGDPRPMQISQNTVLKLWHEGYRRVGHEMPPIKAVLAAELEEAQRLALERQEEAADDARDASVRNMATSVLFLNAARNGYLNLFERITAGDGLLGAQRVLLKSISDSINSSGGLKNMSVADRLAAAERLQNLMAQIQQGWSRFLDMEKQVLGRRGVVIAAGGGVAMVAEVRSDEDIENMLAGTQRALEMHAKAQAEAREELARTIDAQKG